MNIPGFPATRLRRLRMDPCVRRLVQHVGLAPSNLILPLFVCPGRSVREPIPSMPGQFRLSIDQLAAEVAEVGQLGLGGVLLFGIPEKKDDVGSQSWSDDGIVQRAIGAARQAAADVLVVTDVCFCEYTDHGHCGVLSKKTGRADVDNDETLSLLARQAVSHAKAGAGMVAPSGMMDGMVGAIRQGLNQHGFTHVPIMSYAAKYASAFYGPFRDAAQCAPQFGDRRGYQMDPSADPEQAVREIALDLAEGADIVMVKPALAYLDVIRTVHECFPGVPLAAYNVSGEYSMVKAAAERGWIDERAIALESLIAIRRAGADIVLTYWAKDVARWLQLGERGASAP